ncbi:hypothetical protein [Desulfobacter curvatus]|uniref:hypothetical protein n=1 Tax=Desulfobacter curvatus TaxID=2290 RepID=UPI0003811B74|nr:hypothetical protein [Desulfobacter curvatus]
MPLYDLLTGPIMWVTVILFAAGMVFKTISLVRLVSVCRPGTAFINPNARFPKVYKASLPGRYPVTTLISVVFHLILLLLPFFIEGHNILLDTSWGVSLPMLPGHFADNLTVIVLGCGLYFLFRRLFTKRVRAVSFFSDYLIIILVILPFLTGFIAYHRLLPYDAVLNAHIITGQLMLVAIPYTRLVHMIAFFAVRLAKPAAMTQPLDTNKGVV